LDTVQEQQWISPSNSDDESTITTTGDLTPPLSPTNSFGHNAFRARVNVSYEEASADGGRDTFQRLYGIIGTHSREGVLQNVDSIEVQYESDREPESDEDGENPNGMEWIAECKCLLVSRPFQIT
jgi:hypothetical protein